MSRPVVIPPVLSYEFDESYAANVPTGDFSAVFFNGDQVLYFRSADGHDDPSAFGELFDPCFRHVRPGGSANYTVERGVLGPA